MYCFSLARSELTCSSLIRNEWNRERLRQRTLDLLPSSRQFPTEPSVRHDMPLSVPFIDQVIPRDPVSLAVAPPSTASREVSSNSRPFDSSPVTIPPAVLQLWNSQYSLHPYSPLLLTLDFLESSTPHRKPAPSVLRAYMASLPIGLEGAFERARVLRGEGDDAGQVFARYLIGATVEGILEFEGSGVKLKRDYKGWKGR